MNTPQAKQSTGLFLKNAWYAAGYLGELDAQPMLSRTILSQPILLFRDKEGVPAAIGNLCPHRFAPLDRGKLVDGQVRCGYHGLTFNRSGKCVHNPHGKTAGLSVPSYPLAVRQGILWIWMGEPDTADSDTLPHFAAFNEDAFHVRRGYMHGNANYLLMSDNILDLSHIEYLHPALGTDAVSRAKVTVTHSENTVTTTRRIQDEVLPPALAKVYQSGDQVVNRSMEVIWQPPANMVLNIIVEPVDRNEKWRTGAQSLHLFTPESETSAHYFYLASLNRKIQDSATADTFAAALECAFINEDKAMIDAQAAAIGHANIMDLKPALLSIDKAAVLVRRMLGKLIVDEANGYIPEAKSRNILLAGATI